MTGATKSAGAVLFTFALAAAAASEAWGQTDRWSATTPPPAPVDTGAALTYVSSTNAVYAFRGGNTTDFWRFSIDTNGWTVLAAAPAPVTNGAALTYGGGDFIYALRGGDTNFWRYSISANAWTSLAAFPNSVNPGGALLYPGTGDYVYAFRGGTLDFFRYSISSNTWSQLADTLNLTKENSGMVCPAGGDFIYVVAGFTTNFTRYSISTNTWVQLANMPFFVRNGGGIAYPGAGDTIFVQRGNNTSDFAGYSISSNTWTVLAPVPARVDNGGALVASGTDTLYSLRGALTSEFHRYTIGTNTWNSPVSVPGTVSSGGALTFGGATNAYAFGGGSTAIFKGYSTTTDNWVSLRNAPGTVGPGGSLAYPRSGDFIYALRGNTTADFWRYSTSGDAWTPLASIPKNIGPGGALAYGGGDFIYALGGDLTREFWRYSITQNTWAKLSDAPAAVAAGGALAYPGSGDFIYALRGNLTSDFWRYSVSADSWSALTPAPSGVSSGGALVSSNDGNLYAFQGLSVDYWRYSPSANVWVSRAPAPAAVGDGAGLAYPGTGNLIFALRGGGKDEFWWYQYGGANSAPQAPTSLAQSRTTGGGVIPTGGWTNETQVNLAAASSDPDAGDTYKLQFEVRAVGAAFTSPVAVTVDNSIFFESAPSAGNALQSLTVTVSSLAPNATYHWQVRAVDGNGNPSAWVPFPQPSANADNPPSNPAAVDFGVDTTVPITGNVNDGPGADIDTQSSTSTLSANWTGFGDSGAGIVLYEWAIGTTAGGAEVQGFVGVGTATSATNSALTLTSGTMYFITVRATDEVGNSVTVTSDGILVNTAVDTTAPLAGAVNDGGGADVDVQTSPTTLGANWSDFTDAESGIAGYEWAIGTSPGAGNVQPFTLAGVATSASNSSLTLLSGTTYYVTVRATNGVGLQVTAVSDGVLVDATAPAGGLVSDGPGVDIDFQNYTWLVSASWTGFTDPHTGVVLYEWAIGTSPGGSDLQPFSAVSLSNTASNAFLALAHGTTFYVAVRATNGAGLQTVAMSDGVTVDIVDPAAPGPITPSGGASVSGESGVLFDWASVADAVSYRFQLSTDPAFVSPLVDVVMTASNLTSAPLPAGTYYWRVFAIDAAGNTSVSSGATSFDTTGSAGGAFAVALGPASPPPTNQLNSAQNVTMMQLRLFSNSSRDIRIQSIRIASAGTGRDDNHIQSVTLYRDVNGNGVFDSTIDSRIAGPSTYQNNDGSILFGTFNETLPANEARDWLLVYSFAGNAQLGRTFLARVDTAQDIVAYYAETGAPVLPASAFPVDGPAVTIVSSGSPGGLVVTRDPASPGDGIVATDEQTVEMLAFQLTASSVEAILVTGVVVHGFGSGNEATDIGSAYLVQDVGGNGVFNAAVDPVLANAVFGTDNGPLTFSLSRTLPAGGSERWLVVYDMNGTGTAGSTYSLEIRPMTPGDVATLGMTSSLPVTLSGGDFAGALKTVGTLGVDSGDLTVWNIPLPPPAPALPFAHDVLMAAFEISASGLEDLYVLQVRIKGSGSGNEVPDVARAILWEDADGDGTFSRADTALALLESPFASDDGTAAFVLTQTLPAQVLRRWFITYDFFGTAEEGTEFATSVNVPNTPPAVVASGSASRLFTRVNGGVVAGPKVCITAFPGSSGPEGTSSCHASAVDSRLSGEALLGLAAAWAALATLALLLFRRPLARRIS